MNDTPKGSGKLYRRIGQGFSIIIMLLSCLPCMYGLFSFRPMIEYSQLTGRNHALIVILPLFVALVMLAGGVLLLLATILYRPQKG